MSPALIDVLRAFSRKWATPQGEMHGTELELVLLMPDIDAIEAINFEQLATITDRLLLRRGRGAKKRPSYQRIEVERVDLAPELTLRAKPNDIWRRFTTTALLMALFSVSAAIATLI